MAETGRLGDEQVCRRLTRLDDLLGRLEQIPGQTAATAIEAVETLTEVYGEALARVMECVDDDTVRRRITDDELLRHLLVLHDLHPGSLTERVNRGLDDIRPQLRSTGVEAQLTGVDGDVARVEVSGGHGCGSSASSLEEALADSVLAMAPELSAVEARSAPPEKPVIPVDALLHKPAGHGRRP